MPLFRLRFFAFVTWQSGFYARTAQRIFVDFALGFLAHSSADGRITSLDTSA